MTQPEKFFQKLSKSEFGDLLWLGNTGGTGGLSNSCRYSSLKKHIIPFSYLLVIHTVVLL
jgi:hypothetical protein